MQNASENSKCAFGFRGTWRTFDGTNGLPGPAVALLQDAQGYLWIGTWGLGASVFDGESIRTLSTEDGLVGNEVWSFMQDADGALWFGTQTGISRYYDGSFTNYTSADGLVHDDTSDMLRDRSGALWIATEGGISRLGEGESFVNYTTRDGLVNDHATRLARSQSFCKPATAETISSSLRTIPTRFCIISCKSS